MKKNLTLFVFIVIGIFSVTAAAPNWGVADTLEHYEIGPGIEYIKIRYESVPLTLWATTIDMTNPYNVIEQVQSNNSVPDLKRELVQDMSKRLTTPGHKVCAAFNHDFFSYDEGVCIGLNISNGVISMPAGSGRSTFAITQDKTASVFFPVPECKAISASGDEVTIDHFNWGAETIRNGDCVLFTNMNSLNLDAEGRYIKIRPRSNWIVNGTPTVCDVLEVSDLPLQTSDTDFVLYLRNTKLNSLPDIKVGEEITISQKLVAGKFGTPPDNILQAFHGYPSIAYEGKLHDGEYNDFENGREYETSCRTMAGMSQDGKTVYFVATELSENSAGINCIDIANWMLTHGAWNVVNFDSGGSTAIVVDHTMLNLPGRGSLRPVMDGVLLVSTAPEDNGVAHYSFSKTQLNVPIISLAPLTLISQNKYKDVIERNVEVEGFAFRCEPAELGWVDKEAVFHAGETVMSGKIIAEKNGITAELPVSTRPVQDIHIAADEILIDSVRPYRINLEGNINGQVYTLDPAAFAWTSSNPSCCRIENGILKGIENGETSLVGTLDTITVGLKVTVEVTPETLVHENFSDLSDFPLSSTVSNTLSISHEELPTGWPDGAVLQFDQKTGRNPYVEMGKSYRLYSLPDSISLQLNLSKEALAAIKHIRFDFTHKNGKSYWQTEYIPSDTGDQTIVWAFSKNGIAFPTEDFPLTLEAIRFVLNPGSRSEITIPLRELKAYYPVKASSAINNVHIENNFAWITAEGELRLHYNLQQTGSADISIWTTAGQQISEYISNRELPGTYTYNIPNRFLSPGIYILTIRANGKNQSLKFRVK